MYTVCSACSVNFTATSNSYQPKALLWTSLQVKTLTCKIQQSNILKTSDFDNAKINAGPY